MESGDVAANSPLLVPVVKANPQVQGQGGTDLPEILKVQARIRRVLHAKCLKREIPPSRGGEPQQIIRETIAGVLGIEGEVSARGERGVLPVSCAIVELIPQIQGVLTADDAQPGLAVFGFHPEASGIAPRRIKTRVSRNTDGGQTRRALPACCLEPANACL